MTTPETPFDDVAPLSGPVVVLKSFIAEQPLEDEAEKKQKSNAFSVGASGTA